MTAAHFKAPLLGTGAIFASWSVSFLFGIAYATSGNAFLLAIPAAYGIFLLLTRISYRTEVCFSILVWTTIGALLGMATLSKLRNERVELIAQYPSNSAIEAKVVSIRQDRHGTQKVELCAPENDCHWHLEASFSSWLPIRPGNSLTIRNPKWDERSAPEYLYSQGLLASLRWDIGSLSSSSDPSILDTVRQTLNRGLESVLPNNEAALSAGMLVWEKSLFSDELYDAYQRIGLSHLIVVSGSNIALVLTTLLACTRWLRRKTRLPLLLGLTIAYVVLVWGDAPVIRAGIMGLIAYLFVEFGNRVDPIRTLLFASTIICAYSPFSLLYDAGFQLSVLATLGLICASPGISKALAWLRVPQFLGEMISTSVAASLFTLPITFFVFGTTHLASIFANVVIAPFVGIALLGWAISLVGANIWGNIWYWLGFAGYWPIRLCNAIAIWFSDLPWKISIPVGEWRMWLWVASTTVVVLWVASFLLSRTPPASSGEVASLPDPE